MQVSALLQKYRMVTIATCIVCLLCAAYVIYHASVRPKGSGAFQAYYTSDNGATWFADDKDLIPPFDRGGKEVDTIHIYLIHNKLVPEYLERYLPAIKAKLEQAKSTGVYSTLPPFGQTELCALGGTTWVPAESEAGKKMRIVTTDDPDAHEAFP